MGKDLGGLGIFGGQGLAMTAPRCVELDEEMVVLGDLFVEVGISENDDTLVHLGLSSEGH